MNRVRARRPGIVLVTTLFVVMLVVMLVAGVVLMGAGGSALSASFHEREAALMAAESGLQYALTRLQARSDWRGTAAGGGPLPMNPEFSVVERNGNVLGFLRTPSGQRSQFRIKFNYEDGGSGSSGPDGLPDTQGDDLRFRLAMPFVSVNNLLGQSPTPIWRAAPDGRGLAPGEPEVLLPRRTACIRVLGLAGWGVRESEPSNPDAFVGGRAVVQRLVEAYLTLDESASMDSAAYAGGEIRADLALNGVFKVRSADPEEPARLRALKSVRLDGQGNIRFDGGNESEIVVGEGHEFTVGRTTPRNVGVLEEDSSDLFKRMGWDSVPKASAASTSDAQMPGGVYIWRTEESNPDLAWLEYFDQDHGQQEIPPAQQFEPGTGRRVDTATVLIRGSGVMVDPESATLEIRNNVFVNPSESGISSLAVLADPTLTVGGARPGILFAPPEGSTKAPILTAPGSIRLEGSASGIGAMTSEGGIHLQGSSLLETDPETGVSLYAKGDITVEAMPVEVATKSSLLTNVVRAYVERGGDLGALFDYVTTDSVRGLSSADVSALQAAMSDLNRKQRQRLRKLWDQAAGGRGRDAKAAFVERMRKQLADTTVSSGDQSLTGMLYTWKDFRADLGTARLFLRGVLIAYGGNPEDESAAGAPGTEGGTISISAGGVELTYDPTYVRDLVGMEGSLKLRRTLWATY